VKSSYSPKTRRAAWGAPARSDLLDL
jgi:hypothetical protein